MGGQGEGRGSPGVHTPSTQKCEVLENKSVKYLHFKKKKKSM